MTGLCIDDSALLAATMGIVGTLPPGVQSGSPGYADLRREGWLRGTVRAKHMFGRYMAAR